MRPLVLIFALSLAAASCGNPTAGDVDAPADAPVTQTPAAAPTAELVKPPFAVAGDCQGLLLSWFDGEGMHSTQSRAEVPEARRQHVRIASLAADPSHQPAPDFVFVADLRSESGGAYAVHTMARAQFDSLVDGATAAARPAVGDVVLYSASWCGACKATRKFFEERNVTFVEKDIEKDAAANAEMQRKAKAAGKTPRGVPVIDFGGEILMGFDKTGLERLIAQRGV